MNLNQVLLRTSLATGVGKTVCNRIKTEDDVENWPYEEGYKVTCPRNSQVPDKFIAVIRQVVRDILLEKIKMPTVNEIYERTKKLKVKDVLSLNLYDEDVPDLDSFIWPWSRATLHRFMQTCGFIFEDRVTHYEATKSKEDIVSMRDNYLEWIDKHRQEGYDILFQDETWVFKNMCSKKVWKDTKGDSTSGILKTPSGSGERSILSHVISETSGLLEDCMLLYRGAKSNKDSDYHSEMNWDVFSNWCTTKVFPAIAKHKKKSVLVLDRATYHTKLDDEDRRPTTAWNKAKLSDAIIRWKGVPDEWPENWKMKKTKSQLLEQARKIYPTPTYKIQKLANEFSSGDFSIKILFLPVAHPELNPIEMVWSFIKRSVAARNMHFTLSHVEEETKKEILKVTAADIRKYSRHAKDEETKYRRMSETLDSDSF